MDDAVIASASGNLFHGDHALSFFYDCAGVDRASAFFFDRDRLACHRRLVDHHLTGDDFAVERDQIAHTDHDQIAGFDFMDRRQNFVIVFFYPYLVDIQRHRAGQVCNGLLMRPFFEDLADPQHEHDRGRRVHIALQHGNGDRRCIQYLDGKFALKQGRQAFFDVPGRPTDRDPRAQRHREEQLGNAPFRNGEYQFVLKFPVQRP